DPSREKLLCGAAFETRAQGRAPQRLSCLLSDLPWLIVSDDGIEDGEELAGDRNDGDHLGLSSRDQTVEEGLQKGIVLFGDHCAHEQDAAHGRATSPDVALALPLAGLLGVWRQTSKGSDLFAAEGAELGQLGNQRASDHRPDAWNRPEQVL